MSRKESSEGQDQEKNNQVQLGFTEFAKHSINGVECRIDFLPDLITKQCEQVMVNREAQVKEYDGGIGIYLTLAPVKTIFPETKMSNTTLGLIIR